MNSQFLKVGFFLRHISFLWMLVIGFADHSLATRTDTGRPCDSGFSRFDYQAGHDRWWMPPSFNSHSETEKKAQKNAAKKERAADMRLKLLNAKENKKKLHRASKKQPPFSKKQQQHELQGALLNTPPQKTNPRHKEVFKGVKETLKKDAAYNAAYNDDAYYAAIDQKFFIRNPNDFTKRYRQELIKKSRDAKHRWRY